MMPMAPNAIVSVNAITKPKIGFSIDSIVGTNRFIVNSSSSTNICSPTTSDSSERASSPYSDCCYQSEINLCNNNSLQTSSRPLSSNDHATNKSVNTVENVSNGLNNYQLNRFSNSPTNLQIFKPSLSSSLQQQSSSHTNNNINTFKIAPIFSTKLSPVTTLCQSTSPSPGQSETIQHSASPPPVVLTSTQPLSSAPSINNGSILLPNLSHNIIRPFPLSSQNLSDIKTLSTSSPSPYGFNSNNEIVGTRHLPNSHFLAAQFQMASAMANGQPFQQNTHPLHLQNSNLVRDTYPLYPWLIGRNGRIFPHRFPGNFLLQPFRKPKRVRTAFSPSQLLKLEHAFEGNHYVVGAERKTLAQSLHLTETQVKVWFQNRRTKHKRMQQEEDAKNCNNGNISKMLQSSSDDINNDLDHISYVDDDDDDDDELIDMDDCSSDDSNVGQQIM